MRQGHLRVGTEPVLERRCLLSTVLGFPVAGAGGGRWGPRTFERDTRYEPPIHSSHPRRSDRLRHSRSHRIGARTISQDLESSGRSARLHEATPGALPTLWRRRVAARLDSLCAFAAPPASSSLSRALVERGREADRANHLAPAVKSGLVVGSIREPPGLYEIRPLRRGPAHLRRPGSPRDERSRPTLVPRHLPRLA